MYGYVCRLMVVVMGVSLLPALGEADPVARVGTWTLAQEEVDQSLAGKFYELREARIQAMVLEHVLTREAARLKTDPATLLKQQIDAMAIPPTPEEVARFIMANSARLPEGGRGMEDRVRAFMMDKRTEAAKDAYLRGLWKKHAAEILLQPPRFKVTSPQDLSRGPKDAPITLVEFSDFECPYCRRAQATLKAVADAYGEKVRFVFRHYPLPFHAQAPKASEAAQCAADQKKFWPFHDALFQEGAELTPVALKKLAGTLGLDQASFDACLDSSQHAPRVAADTAEGKELGITGTPTFFVNGMRLVGAVPLKDFQRLIDAELKAVTP